MLEMHVLWLRMCLTLLGHSVVSTQAKHNSSWSHVVTLEHWYVSAWDDAREKVHQGTTLDLSTTWCVLEIMLVELEYVWTWLQYNKSCSRITSWHTWATLYECLSIERTLQYCSNTCSVPERWSWMLCTAFEMGFSMMSLLATGRWSTSHLREARPSQAREKMMNDK